MIWPKPRTSFGPNFSLGLAQTFSKVWKRLGPYLAPHLGLPPIIQQPSTTTTSNWVELRNHLTRENQGRAKTGFFDGVQPDALRAVQPEGVAP